MTHRWPHLHNLTTACLLGSLILAAADAVRAQAQEVQFVISATDAEGAPVTDLRPDEILMFEGDVANEVVDVEPYRVPVRLTVAVDNGSLSGDAIGHYRAGLRGLLEALPPNVEVTLITIAPQPRIIVPETTDRVRLLSGIGTIAPQDEAPRFTDALVEFSQRLEDEYRRERRLDSLPLLVMVSTTAVEATSYEVQAVERAIGVLQARKAKVYIAMLSIRQDIGGFGAVDTNRQALISRPIIDATGGRYEALALSNRLVTLLPEFGEEIAALHRKLVNQLLVTVRRHPDLSGPLREPRFGLTRPQLTGAVSVDGLP